MGDGRSMRPRKPGVSGKPAAVRKTPKPKKASASGAEERRDADRRLADDRREMPPRPEGRRRSGGRRTGDSQEA